MNGELNKGISPIGNCSEDYIVSELKSTGGKMFSFSFQELCLWLLISVLLGIGIGSFAMKEFYSYKIWSATNIQGIIYNDKIYDVLPSPKPFHR